MKRKLIALGLAVALIAVSVVSGTLAYLTDTDSATNVFTVGNVSIEYHEDAAVLDKNGAELPGKIETIVENKSYSYKGIVPTNTMKKEATVTNTGNADAYVRVIVILNNKALTESALANVTDISTVLLGWGDTYSKGFDLSAKNPGVTVYDAANIDDEGKVAAIADEDESVWAYYMLLPAGKTVDVFDGFKSIEAFDNAENKMFERLTVEIYVDAIQAEGFDSTSTIALMSTDPNQAAAAEALATAINAFNALETAHPAAHLRYDVVADNAAALGDAASNGEDVVMTDDIKMESATTAPYGNKYAIKQDGGVIDGGGNELTMDCYGDDYGIMTTGGTIKNITIKEGCRAVMIMYPTSDIILDNVNIGGDGVLYPINTGEAGPAGAAGIDLIVTNSTLAGWTSYSNIESASFTNVKFEQGTYYNNIYGRVLKPYVNTTITDCSFVAHMNLDLSGLIAGQKVTFKNCTVDGQAVTADVFTIPTTDAEYDTELFTVDLPAWASAITDCIVFN